MAQSASPLSHRQPVSFPEWKDVLRCSPLPPAIQAEHAREIIAFLRHCKDQRVPATVLLAKTYVDRAEQNSTAAANLRRRESLRWFFRTARESRAARPDPRARVLTPPPAAADLGVTGWEKALIRAVRERHFQWRTEQTYRQWAARFAQFVAPDSPYKVGPDHRNAPRRLRACLQTWIVILNEVKYRGRRPTASHPAGPRRSPLRQLAGCFAALSMTNSGIMGFEGTPWSFPDRNRA